MNDFERMFGAQCLNLHNKWNEFVNLVIPILERKIKTHFESIAQLLDALNNVDNRGNIECDLNFRLA